MKNSLLLILSLLASASPAFAKTDLTMCVPNGRSEFMEIVAVIARDRGFFEKQGLDVRIQQEKRIGSGDWKVKGGTISRPEGLDFAVADKVGSRSRNCTIGASTVERYLAGTEAIKSTKPLFVSSFGDQYDTHMLVVKSSKIKTVKDLRGKKIRLGQLPTYLAASRMLEAHGMTLKDVQVNQGGGNEKFEPVFNGTYAATTAYLPSMAYFLATDQMRILEANIIQKYLGRRIPHSLLIVNTEYAREHQDEVLKFSTAMKEAHSYLMRNRGEIFHALVRSTEHNVKPWRKPNQKANVEKAASFVGQVPFVDLELASEERFNAHCDVRNYADELVRRGVLSRAVDLTDWFGLSGDSRKCPVIAPPQQIAKGS